jgi:RNA polymerase-interacting CarD/CdnL/TRCF family regulator
MKTVHDTSQVIGQCHDRIAAGNPRSVAEFIRNLHSPNQEIELNKTEEELLEELEVLAAKGACAKVVTPAAL